MNNILMRLVCAAEAATGLALLVQPSTVSQLLLGSEPAGAGIVLARICGIALIGLGVACWPDGSGRRGLQGMGVYSAIAAIYMATVGLTGTNTGLLWWPAIGVHAVVAILLAAAGFRKQVDSGGQTAPRDSHQPAAARVTQPVVFDRELGMRAGPCLGSGPLTAPVGALAIGVRHTRRVDTGRLPSKPLNHGRPCPADGPWSHRARPNARTTIGGPSRAAIAWSQATSFLTGEFRCPERTV